MKRRERLTFFGLKKKTGKSCTIPVRCRCREGRGCRGRKAGRVGASRLRVRSEQGLDWRGYSRGDFLGGTCDRRDFEDGS